MCIFGSSPSAPAPPPLPPPLPAIPTPSDENITAGRLADRRRAAAVGNRDSSILTSKQGLPDDFGAPKSILGT